MNWYHAIGGKQSEPVTIEALQQLVQNGSLKPTDYVWNETMGTTWAPVAKVPELSALVPVLPKAAPAGVGLKLAKSVGAQPEFMKQQAEEKAQAAAEAALHPPRVEEEVKLPRRRFFGYSCPNCGRRVKRNFNTDVQKWAGVMGVLISGAFGGFECDNCGTLRGRDFPFVDRLRMLFGSLMLIVFAIGLVIVLYILVETLRE